VAAQVDPPLTERESNYTFIETLKGPLYDRLLTSISGSFADIVVAGECLEKAIKSGKISGGDSSGERRERSLKKKEGEVHAMGYGGHQFQYPQQNYRPYRYQHPSTNYTPFQNTYRYQYPSNNYTPPQNTYRHPYPTASHAQPQNTYQYPVSNATYSILRPSTWSQGNTQRGPRPPQEKRQFTHIPMTYTELYSKLLQSKMIKPIPNSKPPQPPYPAWFDENATCAYHSGAKGHNLENCYQLKRVVQGIIDEGRLTFDTGAQPNVGVNPLPNHGGNGVNVISEGHVYVKRKVEEVTTPLEVVHRALLKAQIITPSQCKENGILSHKKLQK